MGLVVASEGLAGVSAATVSVAGFSRGATGLGSSILGGSSSTLAVVGTSDLDFLTNKSATRAESRRPILEALYSFYNENLSTVGKMTSKYDC